jgi:hypothetical protein
MLSRSSNKETLLNDFLPEYEFRGIQSIVIKASPQRIFREIWKVTLEDMPLARFLGELRYLPGRLIGKEKDKTQSSQPFLELVLQSGNIQLAEDKEGVIGAIGKLHQVTDQEFVPLKDAEEFLKFDKPEYQKLAQSFRISGGDEKTGSTVTFEHRTHALSPASKKKFAFYWLFIKPSSAFLLRLLLRAIKRRAEAANK